MYNNSNPDPFNQWDDGAQAESHEMNERAPINCNQNTYMTGDVRETNVESVNINTTYVEPTLNGEVKRRHLYEVPQEGQYRILWKYSEQFKSILAGLLLLFCGGMHTVWAIYQVLFYQTSEIYQNDLKKIKETSSRDRFIRVVMFSERNVLMYTIIGWYLGVMIGCYVAGWYMIRIVQKRNIYYFAQLIMFSSGCVFYSADVALDGWQALILFARLLAGISHGLAYVTVFVQASENASKDFRRLLITSIGFAIGMSIFIASTFVIYIPQPDEMKAENTAESSETMSAGIMSTVTLVICFISVVINYFYSHETIPFLLYHNYREEEAQCAMAKLLGEDLNAPIVQYEFTALQELCNDDYAEYPEGKIFTKIHRNLMSIALSARITSSQCLNSLYLVLFVKYIQYQIGKDIDEISDDKNPVNDAILVKDLDDILELVQVYSFAVRSAIAVWFIIGVPFTLLGNYFNWKRGLHFTSFIVGASILGSGVFHIFGMERYIFPLTILFVSIYVHFLTMPVDILGYSYLTECFPVSTNAKAIGFVTICESFFNLAFITLEIHHNKLPIEWYIMGFSLCILGYKLYAIVPDTNGLSLAAAKHAYVQAINNKKWWQF